MIRYGRGEPLSRRVARLEEEIVDLRAVVAGMAIEVVTERLRIVDGNDRDRVTIDSGPTPVTVTGTDGVERLTVRCIDALVEMIFKTTEDDTYLILAAGEESARAEVGVTAVLQGGHGGEASLGCESGRIAPGVTEETWGGPLPSDGDSKVWLSSRRRRRPRR